MIVLLKIVLICVVGLAFDLLFIKAEYAEKMGLATILKGIASAFFVALGYVCFAAHPSGFGIEVFYGLILGLIGDVFLNLRNCVKGKASGGIFAIGILAFLAGHIFYISALMTRCPELLINASIVTVLLSVVGIPAIMLKVKAPSKGLKIFGCVYLVVVTAMFSCAAVLLVKTGLSTLNKLFAFGSLLFLVSDYIMIYYNFGKKVKPLRATNLLCYYIGQLFIAISLLFA